MRYLLTIFFCTAVFFKILAQNQIVFNKVYNNFADSGMLFTTPLYNNDYSSCVLTLNDGYVFGSHSENLLWATDTSEQKYDAFFLKVNLHGDTVWSNTFSILDRFEDVVVHVYEEDDLLYFSGITQVDTAAGFQFYNSLLFQTDSSGNVIFSKVYDNGDYEYILDLIKFKQDYFILFNREFISPNYSEPCVSQIDSVGNVIWTKCYGDSTEHFGFGYLELINDTIILTGAKKSSTDLYSFNLSRIDTNGVLLDDFDYIHADSTIIGSGSRENTGIYHDENGKHIIMTGLIEVSPNNYAGYIISIDKNFNKEWERIYDPGNRNESFLSSQVLDDGRIITTSFRNNYENNSANVQCWLLMLDKNGNLIWERFIDAYDDLNAYTYPYQVKKALDGGFVITGYVINNQIQTNGIFHRNDAWLCKTDSCGFTVGAEPEALLVIDSIVGNQVFISNLSGTYCTGQLNISFVDPFAADTSIIDSLHVYAYSEWTSGDDPSQLIYTLPDTGTFVFTLMTYAGDGIDTFTTTISVSDTSTNLIDRVPTTLPFKVFPNPSNDYVIIQLNNSSTDLNGSIVDLNGRIAHSFEISTSILQQKISLPELSNGIYILNLWDNQGNRGIQKLSIVK